MTYVNPLTLVFKNAQLCVYGELSSDGVLISLLYFSNLKECLPACLILSSANFPLTLKREKEKILLFFS